MPRASLFVVDKAHDDFAPTLAFDFIEFSWYKARLQIDLISNRDPAWNESIQIRRGLCTH